MFSELEIRNSVTDQLLTNLKGIEDSPWAVIRKGEPLNALASRTGCASTASSPSRSARATEYSRATHAPSSKTHGVATWNL